MKRSEFDTLEGKLRLKTRDSGDRIAWFEYEGKVITRTRRSHGKGDLPCHDQIRQQLKLNEDQLRALLSCTFGYDDYVEMLRAKGQIL